MATHTLKVNLRRWLPIGLMGILLLVSLVWLYRATQEGETGSAEYTQWLLRLNIFILLLLSLALFSNIVRVIYQWHTRQAGSRFTLRLMGGFLMLSLFPVLVVSFFSMNFIGKNVGNQFSVRIEGALDDSLELVQYSLAIRSREYLMDLRQLAVQLPGRTRLEMAALMDEWRDQHGAYEAILLSDNQHYLITSVDEIERLIPYFTVQDLVKNMMGRDEFQNIEVGRGDGRNLFARVALRASYGASREQAILTALFPFSERERSLANSVLETQQAYKLISFNRNTLKNTFRAALGMIIVLTVLFSIWAAFLFSRRLTRPVRDLVEGTLAVASGDLEKKLPVVESDDFNLLARSFNTMTKRLFSVQVEREQARAQLQREHDYLDVVLEHLSSGVVTLDQEFIIRRVNSSASQILGYPLHQQMGESLQAACEQFSGLEAFLEATQSWLLDDKQYELQTDIVLHSHNSRKFLVCRGAGLPADSLGEPGYVLVFEDVTDVVQAEHDAAWSEVARRLAHEIKNPLTPIQLSAERLNRKLARSLDGEGKQFLGRMTQTIVQQVDTLKAMVNAFSDYAKAPMLMEKPVNLNQVVREVAELHANNAQKVDLILDLKDLPDMLLDSHRMRQLLINLLKNALEAIGDQAHDGFIQISTEVQKNEQGRQVCLRVSDNGPGIPEELLPSLFEPYVTSKSKGTGLGLAIVKKIVEEHKGSLVVENKPLGNGAVVTLILPIKQDHQALGFHS